MTPMSLRLYLLEDKVRLAGVAWRVVSSGEDGALVDGRCGVWNLLFCSEAGRLAEAGSDTLLASVNSPVFGVKSLRIMPSKGATDSNGQSPRRMPNQMV